MEGFYEFLERCERIGNSVIFVVCVIVTLHLWDSTLNVTYSADGYLAGVMSNSK